MILRTQTTTRKTIIYEAHEGKAAAATANLLKKQGFRIADTGPTDEGKHFYLLIKTETE